MSLAFRVMVPGFAITEMPVISAAALALSFSAPKYLSARSPTEFICHNETSWTKRMADCRERNPSARSRVRPQTTV